MHKLKKIIISLTLAFLLLFSFSLSVFATQTVTEYNDYTCTEFNGEAVKPRDLAIGRGGDILYNQFNGSYYYGYFFDEFTITSYSSSSLNISFSCNSHYRIKVANPYVFYLDDYNKGKCTLHSELISQSSSYFYKIDWSKCYYDTSSGIKKGDTFTYFDFSGEETTITFDGKGGVVGYGNEPDNPFDNLQKQEYPEFNLPEFHGKDINDFVDFDSIIDSIKGLDVVGAIGGVLSALRGGFNFVTSSVVNVVAYLTSVLISLFKWLQNTFPVLVNNIVCDISPILMLIVEAVKANPITKDMFEGIFNFDGEGLFSRLDSSNNFFTAFFTEPLKEGLLSLPTLLTSIKDTFNDVSTAITVIKDTLDFSFTSSISAIKDKFTDFLTDFTNFKTQLSFFTKDFFDTKDLNLNIYIKDKISNLKDYLVLKIPFFHTIELIKQSISNMQDSGSVIFTFSAVTLPFGRGEGQAVVIPEFPVTIDIVNVIRKYTDPIIIGICYLSSFIFFKQKIPEVFGGVGGAVAESYSADNKHIGL